MIRYFLLAVTVLLALALALSIFVKTEPRKLTTALRRISGGVLIALAFFLIARGLFVYALPLAFLGYSLITGHMLPSSSWPGSASKSAGQQSRVCTGYIEMRLDHDTGDMEGTVLKGRYAKRMLSRMPLEELLALLGECHRHDGQAAQLLQAYLDRVHPDWREAAGATYEEPAAKPNGGPMSTEEAYRVLGLAPGASADEIRKAHRTLMKKLHPDQGGSNYLASKINEAKDLLLGRAK